MTIPDRPDTVHWFCDSLIFRASGGEQYITIGNFTGDESRLFTDRYPSNRIRSVYGAFSASFAYYYIDKVSLKLLTLADQERFTILSTGITSRDTIIVRDTVNPSDSIRFIDYSVGQRIIKTFLTVDSAHYLTQGFLQPLMSISKSLINKPESSDRILDVYFYPNPTERYLNIKITNPLKGKIIIKAFSSLGFQAYSLSRETADNIPILIRLDLYNLQSGTYLFRVMGSGCHSSYFKIVKL